MRLLLIFTAWTVWGADAPAAGITKQTLTNQGVVLLAQAGYSEGFLIDLIHHKQTAFDTSVEGLAWLVKQGLSERVIRVMVANENKEENTAIVPATVALPPSQAASLHPTRSEGAANSAWVSLPVTMPHAGSSSPSWTKGNMYRDRWYLVPSSVLPGYTRR